jgi:hypothetical protein
MHVRLLAMVFALLAATASIASAPPEPATAETLKVETVVVMNVAGALVFEPDGQVSQVEIATKLVPDLHSAVERVIRRWKFVPVLVDGSARQARTGFRLQLVGTPVDGGYRVVVDGVDFDVPDGTPKDVAKRATAHEIGPGRLIPPTYPAEAQRAGASGTIVLAIRVTPEGKTGDVSVVRSMLLNTARMDPQSARRHLLSLEKESMRAARRWTYKLPADMATRKPDTLTVLAPVEFALYKLDQSATGQWLPVHRFPTRAAPWLPKTAPSMADSLGGAPGSVASLSGQVRLTAPASGDVVM